MDAMEVDVRGWTLGGPATVSPDLSLHRYPAKEAGSRTCAWSFSMETEAQDSFSNL